MSRLGIFVFYDKQGKVDDYVIYLLEQLNICLEELVIVCNGNLSAEGKSRFEKFTNRIYTRANSGFDAMAYKLAMTDYVGWEKLVKYDEVVLLNDTFYGPFYPFSEMFDKMQKSNADFWGITRQMATADYFSYNERILPAYVQSYFWVFRQPVLSNKKFQEYWNQFDSTNWIFSDVVNRHEKLFTQKLEEMGFCWDTYVKAEEFESEDAEKNFNQYYYVAYNLIKDYRCPILKRKNFIMKHLTENAGQSGEDIVAALRYIEDENLYDIDLMWDNLLRLYNINDIKTSLNLNYIVEDKGHGVLTEVQNNAAVMIWLSSKCSLTYCKTHIESVVQFLDVYVLSDDKEILDSVSGDIPAKRLYCECVSRGVEGDCSCVFVSKFSEIAEDYKYVAFLHDIDFVNGQYHSLDGYSMLRAIWTNLLGNEMCVRNIIQLFEDNRRLGFLALPQLVYGTHLGELGNTWEDTFTEVNDILACIGEEGSISENTACPSTQHAFWCRAEALKAIAENEDVLRQGQYRTKAMARSYPYMVQAAGYYTGTVMNSGYASMAYTNIEELLRQIVERTKREYDFRNWDDYLDGDMLAYSRRFEGVLVYGAGENGYRVTCMLKKHDILVGGFVISEGQPTDGEKYGYPVYYVTEIPEEMQRFGIVVSVANPKVRSDIVSNLYKKGYEDIYIL